MDSARSRTLVKRGKKYKLIWIVHITIPELSRKCSSPVFETKDGIKWKISLKPGLHSMEDYLFCTLFRMPDGESSQVHNLLYCKIFIGEKEAECKKQPLANEALRNGSFLDMPLLPVSFIKKSAGTHPSGARVKLTLQFCLQIKPFRSLQFRSLSVVTTVEKTSLSFPVDNANVIYGSKKEKCVREPSKSRGNVVRNDDDSDDEESEKRDYGGYICLHTLGAERKGWYSITFKTKGLDTTMWSQWHLLDVHGRIYASTDVTRRELGLETTDVFNIIKRKELWKKRKILSRDGEISFNGEFSLDARFSCTAAAFSPLPLECGADLRRDLKRLFHDSSKDTDLEIRIDGATIKVHKDVICARSPVFNAMLSNDMIEKQLNVVDIEGFDLVTLKNFLNYVYSGTFETRMEWEDVCNLYVLANKYFVKSLCRVCSRQLTSMISLENCKEIWILSRFLDDKSLQKAVTAFKRLHENDCMTPLMDVTFVSEKESGNISGTSED